MNMIWFTITILFIMLFIMTLSMINDIKEIFEYKCEHEYADGLCIRTVR